MAIRINYNPELSKFIITCPQMDLRAKEAPESKWHKDLLAWVLPSMHDNCAYLREQFDSKYFEPHALARVLQQINTQPTIYEPFGMTPLEAMASEIPVIVSRCAGVAEIMSDEKYGILLDNPSDC